MSINFFQPDCKSDSSRTEFGICDDVPNSPAYIDETDRLKWIGIVKNPHKKYTEFYAIDNCLNLRKEDGNLESTCDGVLKESTNLIFVELKERGSGKWFGKGREQITNTINLFKANHDISAFSSVSAYVCNNLKPFANSGRAVSIQKFKDDTGFLLKDQQEVSI